MSTYLAMRDEYPDALGPHAKELPIFLAHGTADMVGLWCLVFAQLEA